MTPSQQSTTRESTTTTTERSCRNCGAFVSRRFTRVFGDNDDDVYGCLECMSTMEVRNGGTRPNTSS